jgi:VanZ family protein
MATTPLFLFNSTLEFEPAPSRLKTLVRAWLPVALFASIFAIESTAAFGTDHTSAPLHSLWQLMFGDDANQGWSYTHHIIRKVGHFTGYGLLSLICFRGFWITSQAMQKTVGHIQRTLQSQYLAVAATFCVASTDELHQHFFLPNRTGNFGDVLLDSSGALSMQTLLLVAVVAIAIYDRYRENQIEKAWNNLHPQFNSQNERVA